uniref:Si:ch73-15b2.5 n=1 Tax=Tetraodon nigroviridis TaxID=99883 RepID=H3DB98_TETNG
MFSNILGVMAASQHFLLDLEARLERSVIIPQVGDVVLQHCPAFRRLYMPYVTNMMYQEALVDQLLQQNRAFSSLVRKLESEPVCQRQSLKSFLVLPFQRITRIKLILENILKLTEPGSDTIGDLEGAVEAIHEIVVSCDARVRRMKQVEELICLDARIDFGSIKAVPLIVGGRFLVREGPVRQLCVEPSSRVSLADVHLHLFSDLLIISTHRDQRFTVTDHAAFPAHVHVEHLKPQSLGLPADSFLLHLSRSQNGHPTAMILVAPTRSDKEMWITALS